MECYRVQLPIETRVAGATANGEVTCVLPGEYLVHRLFPKLPTRLFRVLRFVGADPAGRDVHVTLGALCNLPASLGVSVVRVEDENELRSRMTTGNSEAAVRECQVVAGSVSTRQCWEADSSAAEALANQSQLSAPSTN